MILSYPLRSTPLLGESSRNIGMAVTTAKTGMMWLLSGENV